MFLKHSKSHISREDNNSTDSARLQFVLILLYAMIYPVKYVFFSFNF